MFLVLHTLLKLTICSLKEINNDNIPTPTFNQLGSY